jgi:hypothetical protein
MVGVSLVSTVAVRIGSLSDGSGRFQLLDRPCIGGQFDGGNFQSLTPNAMTLQIVFNLSGEPGSATYSPFSE